MREQSETALKNPYSPLSEAIQFVFRVNAPIVASKYTWNPANKVEAFPQVDIQKDYLYNFYGFSFTADIDILDYQAALDITSVGTSTPNSPNANTLPTFSMYMKGQSSGPILRQPLGLPNYYSDIDYRFWKKPKSGSGTGSNNQGTITQLTGQQVSALQGSFNASLLQVPNLVGKQSVNLIMTFFAQEITDSRQQELLLGRKIK